MADIELVVKIPEEIRLALINNIQLSLEQQSICDSYIKQAIINGIPLPKGHGDLIDRAELHLELDSFMYGISSIHELIDEMKPIIEADKEQEWNS